MKCRAVSAPWVGIRVLKPLQTPYSCRMQPHTLGVEWKKPISSSRNFELRSLFLKKHHRLLGDFNYFKVLVPT